MSRRLTRQEMKKDEVRDTLASIFWWIESHFRQILIGVAGMLVLGMIGTAVYLYLESRQESAHEALAAALPEVPDEAGEAAPGVAGEEQRAATTAALATLREEYGGTDAARIGGAILGSQHAAEGDLEAAGELWREFDESSGSEALAASIRVNLWNLDRHEGRGEAVVAELETLIGGSDGLPEDLLLDQLALTFKELGRAEEAGETYRRLIDDHPGSPFAITAQRELASLGSS